MKVAFLLASILIFASKSYAYDLIAVYPNTEAIEKCTWVNIYFNALSKLEAGSIDKKTFDLFVSGLDSSGIKLTDVASTAFIKIMEPATIVLKNQTSAILDGQLVKNYNLKITAPDSVVTNDSIKFTKPGGVAFVEFSMAAFCRYESAQSDPDETTVELLTNSLN